MCAKGESPRLLEGSPHDEGISSPYHRLMWAADARQGSLPMPRFSLMQAAPAGSRVIPDRPSDKDHEEGKGKSSEDTWGQKWARFDTLRLPSWCFHSGIFWAFETYHCLCMIIPPFLTICYSQHHQPNFLHHTIPLHALSRWCSSKGRRKVFMHRNVLSHNILLDTLLWPKKPSESQWSRFDAIWSPGISDLEPWLASLSAELVGRIREVGTSVDSQRGRSAWNQVTVKWYNSFPARIQHGNHGVWSYTIVVVLIRTGIMCYWLRE